MIELFVADYGLFLLKVLTLLVALALLAAVVAAIVARARARDDTGIRGDRGRIEVVRFNERLEDLRETLALAALAPAVRREARKARRKAQREKRKAEKREARAARRAAAGKASDGGTAAHGAASGRAAPGRARLYVVDFNGDIRASAVERLRREITAVLAVADPGDELLVRLDSGGGTVTGYGLGAAQLERVRAHGMRLTVCVDRVAASGGYMMAAVADRIVAAPFAVLGSIGVVAQIPNFHRLLKERDIDVELITAGKYKRTLTVFGENTEEGRRKFREDIERIHAQFKEHVARHRPGLDIERVATGEFWSGEDALALALVDELATSDERLVSACEKRDVLLVRYRPKRKRLVERLAVALEEGADRLLLRWLERLAGRSPFA